MYNIYIYIFIYIYIYLYIYIYILEHSQNVPEPLNSF